MNALSAVIRYGMFSVLAALAVMVAYRLLTGQIKTKGLLRDKVSGRPITVARLQMLIATLILALYYLAMVIEKQELPVMQQRYLLALGVSHLLYLSGKTYGVLARKLELAATRIAGRKDQ